MQIEAKIREKQIQYLSEVLHWIRIGEDGVTELYLDNHMMQTFRMCESHFIPDFVEGYSGRGRQWFLDFGSCTHTMIEYYYVHRNESNFNILDWAGALATECWSKLNMDANFAPGAPFEHKNYTLLGGLDGFRALLLQYAQIFHTENERMRVIGTELYFGKGKEVLLGETKEFRLYLCGKIDLLMDDGFNIGPMDHKTSSNFGFKNPVIDYEIHEGMTGYVFAAKKLLTNMVYTSIHRNGDILARNTNKIWMNFLQVTPLPQKRRDGTKPSIHDRFKRVPIFVTDYQLEQYRLRQLSTAARILQLLLNPDLLPTRNTMACTNYMHHVCTYHEVHRQNSRENELVVLGSNFVRKPIWNPEEREDVNL